MNLKIKAVEHNIVYRHFSKGMRQEQVAIKKMDDKTEYLGAYLDDELIGVVGWQEISTTHIRYKTDYVKKRFRGKKIYTHLWKSRDFAIFIGNYKVISAYCTPLSINQYLYIVFCAFPFVSDV